MLKKKKRDVTTNCSAAAFANTLRRLADALEQGRPFRVQVAGERIRVPARALYSIEHEREGAQEEVEFQITWTNA
jgi:amphi-Trp domain-containing protein